ncbi:MAG: DUF697 domain-containing protein [Pseudazoarcus pumilus]|nr:DUF697 domain-containing protein [Pseudazoarcus pumilus]
MDIPGRERLNAYRERLLRALLDPQEDHAGNADAPAGTSLPVAADRAQTSRGESAEQEILAHARRAAALGVLPVVDLIAVTTLQARLLRRLAHLHGVEWDTALARDFIARLGPGVAGGIVGHTVGRSVLKIVPLIGQTAGAAWSARSSAISTFAIGKAADYYLGLHALGQRADAASLRSVHARAAGHATTRVRQLIDPATR